jgi:hypothetical protein
MLLYVDGNIVEIRPSELFESKELIDSRHLELIIEEKLEEPNKKRKIKEVYDLST